MLPRALFCRSPTSSSPEVAVLLTFLGPTCSPICLMMVGDDRPGVRRKVDVRILESLEQ